MLIFYLPLTDRMSSNSTSVADFVLMRSPKHPTGAAFAASPGLTLDLPPFSHFRLNVMWIDDHTLVSAAKAIKRPADLDVLPEFRETGSTSAGHPVKWRAPPTNVAWYTLEMYMPTLLWGCILDAFMTSVPSEGQGGERGYLLKLHPADVAADRSLFGGSTERLLKHLRSRAANSHGVFVNCIRQV